MTEAVSQFPPPSSPLQMENGFELLCCLTSAHLHAERIDRIKNWSLSAIDWTEFLGLAEHYGVLPLAARNLIDHARDLPPEIERALRSSYETNLKRSLWFAAELTRIMQH